MEKEKERINSEEIHKMLIKEIGDNNTYYEIMEKITNVRESLFPDDLRRVLLLVRRLQDSEVGDKEEKRIALIYKWMRVFLEEQSESFVEQLNWWVKIYIEKYMTDLRPIFDAIEKADREEKAESIADARKLIEGLDKNKHKYNILILDKRLTILEKRLERTVNNNFSSLIKGLRSDRGLSLVEAGKLAGVSASYINRLEMGDRKAPSIPIIEKLADALAVDVSVLLAAAGLISSPDKNKSLKEIFFSNDVYISDPKEIISNKKKEAIIEIVDFIESAEWENNKHVETVELINLVDKMIKSSKS